MAILTAIKSFSGPVHVFHDKTVPKGTSINASIIELRQNYNAHSLGGKFAGTGTLRITYKTGPIPDTTFLKSRGNIIDGFTVAGGDSPFEIPLPLFATRYLYITATETVSANDITGLFLYLTETGS